MTEHTYLKAKPRAKFVGVVAFVDFSFYMLSIKFNNEFRLFSSSFGLLIYVELVFAITKARALTSFTICLCKHKKKIVFFFLLFSNPWALGGIRSSWTHKMWIPIEFVDIPLTIYISCANSTEIIMRVNVGYPNPSAVAAAAMILIWKNERRKVEALKVNYSDGSCGIGSIQHIASFIQFMCLCIERSPTTYLLDWANKWVQCREKISKIEASSSIRSIVLTWRLLAAQSYRW